MQPKTNRKDPLDALDGDQDGFATQAELSELLEGLQADLILIQRDHKPKGVILN